MKKVSRKHQRKSGLEIARLAAIAALDKKAEDLIVLDVRGICSFADYFVIMSGRSSRHVQGLADAVDKALRDRKLKSTNTEGLQEAMWVLLDYDDVVVHIFYHETRSFYNLEGLWHDGVLVDITNEEASSENSGKEKTQQ